MKFKLSWLNEEEQLRRLMELLPQLERLVELLPMLEKTVEMVPNGERLGEIMSSLEELVEKFERQKRKLAGKTTVKKSTFIRNFHRPDRR